MCITILTYLIVGGVHVDGVPFEQVRGEDICESVGSSFCNGSECLAKEVPIRGGVKSTFTCKCDRRKYFNAAALRCFHVSSCLVHTCERSTCVDDDGSSEAWCEYENGTHIQDPTLAKDCTDSGGQLEQSNSETSFNCICPHGAQLVNGSCHPNRNCTQEEVNKCAERGRQCVLLDAEALCTCPENAVELADRCSEKCSPEKDRECSTPLSRCTVQSGKETCVCLPLLQWNSSLGHCVPEAAFKLTVNFKVQPEVSQHSETQEHCNDTTWEENVFDAMKILYGNSLTKIAVLECGTSVTMELTFSEKPNPAVLLRIHLCEIRSGSTGCIFQPKLRIVKGSVSDPVPVDLCATYFRDVHNITGGSFYCTDEGNGRYTLRCAGGNVTNRIVRGELEIQQCQGTQVSQEGAAAASNYKTAIVCSSVFIAVFTVLFIVLVFRKRIYYYRVLPEDTECSAVKFQAAQRDSQQTSEDQEATANLVTPKGSANSVAKQGAENEDVAATT
ncbi:uncharacterized protein [Dermacentor albipictus]|uniref:uncharacterized protein isoform X2 n=1 Tax=Dermacentor albipictus TaxID=60249 RepID=UPI0031FD757D